MVTYLDSSVKGRDWIYTSVLCVHGMKVGLESGVRGWSESGEVKSLVQGLDGYFYPSSDIV